MLISGRPPQPLKAAFYGIQEWLQKGNKDLPFHRAAGYS